MDLLKTGRVDHTSLATHTFAPQRYREAIDQASGRAKLTSSRDCSFASNQLKGPVFSADEGHGEH